jgi:hypothetical protein
MQGVTVSTCNQWVYGTTRPLVTGPDLLKNVH